MYNTLHTYRNNVALFHYQSFEHHCLYNCLLFKDVFNLYVIELGNVFINFKKYSFSCFILYNENIYTLICKNENK